jgi:transcriptional regulator with XRE-family HTH domain
MGQRLADLRRMRGRQRGYALTQQEVADEVGVSRQTVISWERDRRLPSPANLVHLARVLDTSPQHLLSGVEQDSGVTAAEIIRFVDHPAVRDVFGERVTETDRIQMAFQIAAREGLGEEEMDRLRTWRELKRSRLADVAYRERGSGTD